MITKLKTCGLTEKNRHTEILISSTNCYLMGLRAKRNDPLFVFQVFTWNKNDTPRQIASTN